MKNNPWFIITTAVLVWFALLVLSLRVAAEASADPGYGSDCIRPSVSTCRLMPDADGPHVVQRFCAGKGWINVFEPCYSRFGPYA